MPTLSCHRLLFCALLLFFRVVEGVASTAPPQAAPLHPGPWMKVAHSSTAPRWLEIYRLFQPSTDRLMAPWVFSPQPFPFFYASSPHPHASLPQAVSVEELAQKDAHFLAQPPADAPDGTTRLLALQGELDAQSRQITQLRRQLDLTTRELLQHLLPSKLPPAAQRPSVASPLTAAQKEWLARLQEGREREEGIATLQAAVELLKSQPHHPLCLSEMARVFLRQDQPAAASLLVERLLALEPKNPDGLATQGMLRFQEGRFEEAVALLQKSLQLAPKNARTLNYLGIALSQAPSAAQAQQAEGYLRQALAVDPHYAEAHFNLALLLATKTPPDLPTARYHYYTATSLGALPDLGLERLLQ